MTGMLKVNAPIYGYNYTNSANAPAFVFDKSGSNYTGIGSNGENDTILFAPVNTTDYSWVSNYNQRWAFQGSVTADTYIKAKQGFTTDETMNMYAERNNEINFGGTNNSNTVYFGYREKDSKPIPTQFVFGGTTGTAKIIASNIPTYSYSNGTLTITM